MDSRVTEEFPLQVEPGGLALSIRSDETLLDALKRHGYTVFYGCRRGGCGVCRVTLTAGQVVMGPYAPQALDDLARETGQVLACRAKPSSPLVIRIEESNRFRRLLGWPWGPSSAPVTDR